MGPVYNPNTGHWKKPGAAAPCNTMKAIIVTSCWVLGMIKPSHAALYSLSDASYPYLSLVQPQMPVVWHEKTFSLAVSMSKAVRINSRGIQFISPGGVTLTIHDSSNWFSARCVQTTGALCTLEEITNSSFFPSVGYAVKGPNPLYSDLFEYLIPKCTESTTGRVIPFINKGPSSEDMSLCNVIGGGADVVFVPGHQKIYVAQSKITFYPLMIIGLLTVFLSIVLAHNMEYLLGTEFHKPNTILTEIAILLLAIVVIAADNQGDPLGLFISMEDRFAFIMLLVYTLYYLIRSLQEYWCHEMHSPVNQILAILALAAMRVHSTLDNIYTVVSAFMIATRLINKIFMMSFQSFQGGITVNIDPKGKTNNRSVFGAIDILVDSLILAILLYVGVVPHNQVEPIIVSMYILQGFFVSIYLNQIIMSVLSDTPHKGRGEGK